MKLPLLLRACATVTGCLFLMACGGLKSGAEEAVRKSLNDPESARFGELYFNEKTNKGCLAVNAKNAMGGYSGEQLAYVKRTPKGWIENGIAPIDLEGCRKVYADWAD